MTLPIPESNKIFGLYDEKDMITYATAAVLAEREACAKLCDDIEAQAWALWRAAADPIEQGRNIGAQHCADAIRARTD